MAIAHISPLGSDDDTPGVDIVLTAENAAAQAELLERRVRTLVGALHRRFWDRRRELLLQRAPHAVRSEPTSTDDSGWTVDGYEVPLELRGGPDFCADSASSWDARVEAFGSIRAPEPSDPGGVVDVIRVRGWDATEPAVLVDGSSVPGAVFDLAVVLGLRADELRDGYCRFWVCLPEVHDPVEARLWNDLVNIAQDRLGITRGTVRIVASIESADAAHRVDPILSELRSHAAAVCVADGCGVDEAQVKDGAARRGAMFIGAVAASNSVDILI